MTEKIEKYLEEAKTNRNTREYCIVLALAAIAEDVRRIRKKVVGDVESLGEEEEKNGT